MYFTAHINQGEVVVKSMVSKIVMVAKSKELCSIKVIALDECKAVLL